MLEKILANTTIYAVTWEVKFNSILRWIDHVPEKLIKFTNCLSNTNLIYCEAKDWYHSVYWTPYCIFITSS